MAELLLLRLSVFVAVVLPQRHTAEAIGACFFHARPAPYAPLASMQRVSCPVAPAMTDRCSLGRGDRMGPDRVAARWFTWPASRRMISAPVHDRVDVLAAGNAVPATRIVERQQHSDARESRLNTIQSIVFKLHSVAKAFPRWLLFVIATLSIGILSPNFRHAPSCFACLGSCGGGPDATQESSVLYTMAPESDPGSLVSATQKFTLDQAMRPAESMPDLYSDEYDEGPGPRMTRAPVDELRESSISDDWIPRTQTAGSIAPYSSASGDVVLNQIFQISSVAARASRCDTAMQALLNTLSDHDRKFGQAAYDSGDADVEGAGAGEVYPGGVPAAEPGSDGHDADRFGGGGGNEGDGDGGRGERCYAYDRLPHAGDLLRDGL